MGNNNFRFDLKYKSALSRARCGQITTPHGFIETPAFVTVGTKGTVKSLSAPDLDLTGTQFVFVNTYHMVISPGTTTIANSGGIHRFSRINKPIITDSGGFQVFSLAGHKKIIPAHDDKVESQQKTTLVTISEKGVKFRSHIDGNEFFFTPEFSIQSQIEIGADFVVAFDEDIYNGASKSYTKNATDRTHRWGKRSLDYFVNHGGDNQRLYGIIHGGRYEDIRKESAKYIASLPFWGLALGGISVNISLDEFHNEVTWVSDTIHTDPRPRHLLGIGTQKEILYAVEKGFDTFDCIVPARQARIGKLYTRSSESYFDDWNTLNILQSQFKSDNMPIDPHCLCHVCKNYSRSYLNHLFKQKELLAYRLATIHNLFFIEEFFKEIRRSIEEGKF